MEHLLIPHKRSELVDKKMLRKLTERLNCRIEMQDNEVVVEGAPYDEYNAKNVIQAFGRGFGIDKALKLLNDDYFFKQINLKDVFRNKDQIARIKARIIGSDGKTKNYIESVSGVDMAIFGSTVSAIGRIDELSAAEAAINVLIEGGRHKTAYRAMEMEKRKHKEEVYA